MSSAIASGERQRPMISRNETRVGESGSFETMPPLLGHSVLKSKAKVSCDCGEPVSHNTAMADRMSESEEKAAFIQRVKLARMARYDAQKPMITILGIDQGTYKQYETRTPLPHRLIPKFCAATGVSLEWLLTGEGKGPVEAEIPRQAPRRTQRHRRGKAA